MSSQEPIAFPGVIGDTGYLPDLSDATSDPIRWAFLAAVQLLHVGRASLLVFRGDDKDMTVVASVGIDPAVVPTIRVPAGSGIAGLVAERDMAILGEANGVVYLSVPVRTPRRIVGVLNMTNRLDGRNLNDSDLEWASSTADHLGYLLQQASETGLDARTGLPDRWAFEEMVERELARSARTGDPLTVMVMRVLGLDDARRRIGESEVGMGLRAVTTALRPIMRRYDVVGWRDVGFAILVPGTAEGSHPAERILSAAQAALEPLGTGMTLDVGWAHGPADGGTAAALLTEATRRAEKAQTAR
jgi:GGDEF domain-containing protein